MPLSRTFQWFGGGRHRCLLSLAVGASSRRVAKESASRLRLVQRSKRHFWVSSSASSRGLTTGVGGDATRVLCVDLAPALAEPTCVQELIQRGHQVDQLANASESQLEEVIGLYDALVVSPRTPLSGKLLQKGASGKLQAVAVPSDHIDSSKVDIMEATNQGILMLQLEKKQVADKSSVEAEIALSLLLQLARNIPRSMKQTKSLDAVNGSLRREDFVGTELMDKTLGIVGLGQAGKCIAEMAQAMGLRVVGYDPTLSEEAAESLGVKKCSLDNVYATSDFLAFHAPLTEKTESMFDDQALAKCKQGVKIASVAEYKGIRGILHHDTLLKGLESGQIGGIGLDVLLDSSRSDDIAASWKQLLDHERVIVRSHGGADGGDSASSSNSLKLYRTIAENLSDALAKRHYRGVGNAVFMPFTILPELAPFLQLSEAMGRISYQLVSQTFPKDPIARVCIATSGGLAIDITQLKVKSALQNSVMKGMIRSYVDKHGSSQTSQARPRLSLINSTMLAMTKGIDVRLGELDSNIRGVNNSITVQVETKSKKSLLVMGSVFGEEPRIVQLSDHSDFPAFRPEGNLLIFQNHDKPGAIAGILKELADSGINIANFGLSRQENVEFAMGILSLDSTPSDETIARLKELPSVETLQTVHL